MEEASNYCGNVIQLDDRRPVNTGLAFCLLCGHRWTAVAPIGTVFLECPLCKAIKGVFKFNCTKSGPHWECDCGNRLFYVTDDGYYCPNCGQDQWGF